MQDTRLKRPSDLPESELLAMLAEEATELAQAALKLRRAIDKTNPTPRPTEECSADLLEEMGDVELCFDMYVDCITSEDCIANRQGIIYGEVYDTKRRKFERWVARLNDEADS